MQQENRCKGIGKFGANLTRRNGALTTTCISHGTGEKNERVREGLLDPVQLLNDTHVVFDRVFLSASVLQGTAQCNGNPDDMLSDDGKCCTPNNSLFTS